MTEATAQPYPGTPYVIVPARPLGVAILSVLVGLFGFLMILEGLLALIRDTRLGILGAGFGLSGLPVGAVGALTLVLGVIVLAAAVGLWRLHLWAFVLAIVVTFLVVVSSLLTGQILGLILAVVILGYLLAVHRHFH